jgi:hypothetical protein
MSYQPSPREHLILWRLAVAGGGDWNKEIKPDLNAPERKRLLDAGLIEIEKRKPESGGSSRPLFVTLTEQGWGWLSEHVEAKFPNRLNPAATFERLLPRLKEHLDAQRLSLGEFLNPSRHGGASGPAELRSPAGDGDARAAADLPRQIEAAYDRLSGGQPNVRVRLAELRSALPGVPRRHLDDALLSMATRGQAALYPLENPLEIRPEDREAVLRTPAGDERHIIYLGGPGS